MIEEVFNLFDTDGQQQLDVDELSCAICAMGFCQTGYGEVLPFCACVRVCVCACVRVCVDSQSLAKWAMMICDIYKSGMRA